MPILVRDDVKTYLKITGSEADDRIDDLVLAAIDFVKSYCDITLISQTDAAAAITEYFHGPDNVFILPQFPIATTPALVLYDDWSRKWAADTIVDTDDYYVDYDKGIIYCDYDIGQGKMTVRADYTIGYTTGTGSANPYPADLKQACVEIVARKLKEGEGALGVPTRAIPQGGTVAFGIDDILPQTKIVLDLYKR